MADYQGRIDVYEVGPRLGGGGMAEVLLGWPRGHPSQRLAIKVPLPGLPPDISALFLREADAAAQVSSPYAVNVVDWGEDPAFIAFEYIEAPTLGEQLRNRQGLGQSWIEQELIGLFLALAEGMHSINDRVVHRDLKPENIFMSDDGSILKIADFGIAKYVDEMTRTRTFKGWGTPQYMAPETFRNESADWRSDQYSLGVVFFEMATLSRPFVGTWDELEQLHLYQRPPRVTASADSLSERLASIIARMLEKRAEQRFPSWTDVIDELKALAEQKERDPLPLPSAALAREAAKRMDEVRNQQLQRAKAEDETRRKTAERRQLLEYWSEDMLGQVAARVVAINQELGEDALYYVRNDNLRRAIPYCECQINFVNAQLLGHLEVVPLDSSEELILWGWIELDTKGGIWVGNLLLAADPPPYGGWLEVDMRVSSLADRRFDPNQGNGGGIYRVLGSERLVIADNVEGILFRRSQRNMVAAVDYTERPLDLKSVLDEIFEILVQDSGSGPPTTPRGGRWSPI